MFHFPPLGGDDVQDLKASDECGNTPFLGCAYLLCFTLGDSMRSMSFLKVPEHAPRP